MPGNDSADTLPRMHVVEIGRIYRDYHLLIIIQKIDARPIKTANRRIVRIKKVLLLNTI